MIIDLQASGGTVVLQSPTYRSHVIFQEKRSWICQGHYSLSQMRGNQTTSHPITTFGMTFENASKSLLHVRLPIIFLYTSLYPRIPPCTFVYPCTLLYTMPLFSLLLFHHCASLPKNVQNMPRYYTVEQGNNTGWRGATKWPHKTNWTLLCLRPLTLTF